MQSAFQRGEQSPVELRLQSDRLRIRFAFASEVVSVGEAAEYTRPASSKLNYTSCNAVKRREVAKTLDRDIVPVKWGEMLRQSTLQWAVAELQYRIPLPSVNHAVVNVSESRAVVNMDEAVNHELEELEIIRKSLNSKSLVVVLLHTDSEHYTVLRRVVQDEVAQYTYWDSLTTPSAASRTMAQQFMSRLQWHGPVPPPVNKRFQSGGWECGLFSLQFVEECLREARGELVPKSLVALQSIMDRVNQWITKCAPFLPPVAIAAPSASTEASSAAAAKSAAVASAEAALAAASPVQSGPVLEHPLAPVSGDALPSRATLESDVSELTFEQARAARAQCTKGCQGSGCTHCMGKWFVPKSAFKAVPKAE